MKILFAYRNCESLGIEYISSILKQNGHKTDLIFDPGAGDVEFKFNTVSKFFKFEKDMLVKIKHFSPDLIAFSSMTNLFPWVKKMTTLIKEQFDIPILVGGLHPTASPLKTITYKHIDYICRGEGEYPTLELIEKLESGQSINDIKNIWLKVNGKIKKNPIRPLINNLDELPFPDKDLFFKYGAFSKRYYIMAARGCPFECSYCYNKQLKEIYGNAPNYYRLRTVDNVINELKWALERYNYKKIYFYDDIFGLNLKWLKNFANKYKNEINKPYKCLLRPQNLTKEKLSLLKKSGCQEIDIGLESGNERVRKEILNRNISNKIMYKNLYLIKQSGIDFSTLNIIGNPTETIEEMLDTFEMNYKIKPKGALFHILYPFPETTIYHKCIEEGDLDNKRIEIVKEGISSYRSHPIITRNYDYVVKFNIFAPIFLKLPPFFKKFLFKIPPLKIFRIISIYFLTTPRNFRLRIFESLILPKIA